MDPQELLLWPASFGTPSFTRTASGELTGDGMPDAVTLSGTQPVLLWNVAYYDAQIELPRQANDFDIAAYTGTLGPDGVAVVNGTGLELITLTSPTSFSGAVIEQGVWAGALRLRCGNIDSSGPIDFVGIASDGHEVLVRYGDASSTTSFTSTNAVLGLEIGQWDLGALEIFLLTTSGLELYEPDGTPVASFANAGTSGGFMTILRASRDRVACVFPTTFTHELRIYRAGFSTPTETVALPTLLPAGLTSGDFDGDGDFDIVVSHKSHLAPLLRLNQGPGSIWFTQSASVWMYVDDDLLEGSSGSDNTATPLCADMDFDGKADLLVPAHQTSSTPGAAPAHVYLQARPCIEPQTFPYFREGYLCGENSSEERWTFLRAQPVAFPPQANAYAVVVWKQAAQGATLDDSPHVPYTYHTIASSLLQEDPVLLGLKLDIQESTACLTGATAVPVLYWFDVAPVHVTNGVIDNSSFAHRIVALSASEEDVCEYLCDLGDLPFSMAKQDNFPPNGSGLPNVEACSGDAGDCNPNEGTTPLPVVVSRTRLPSHGPGIYPTYANSPPTPGAPVFHYAYPP
jgi:hypothetical protein